MIIHISEIRKKSRNSKMRWIKIFLASLAIFLVGNVVSNSSGPSSGYTGAPNENDCTSCHSGTSLVTSGSKWNRVRMGSNIPSTGYLMDSTYTITLTYAETGISTFGFQLTSLSSDSSKAAGTFATTDARTQKNSGTVSGLTRNYIEHTATGNAKVGTDSTSWVFKWKAPSKNRGGIVFYVNVNAANGNGSSSGDVIYGKSFKVSQSSKLPVASARLVDTPACANAFRFAGSANNSPTSFEWFTFDAAGKYKLLSNKQNPTLSQLAGSVNNVIYFKAYNSFGESNTVKLTYTVNDSPVKPKVSPTGSNYICSGDSLKITAISQSALGYTQRWLPINNAKLSLFVKDSGIYFSESKNKIGCITFSDTIRLVIKKRPTVSADFTPSKTAYCTGSLIILKAKGSFADSFGTNVKGPFKTDSLISLSAKSGNTFINVYSKSANGCVSSAAKKSYVVADSSFKVLAAPFDLSLTSVTFRWFAHTSAMQYEVSKDSGKTWTKTGNSGKDTFYNISSPNAYSLLKLWVRYTVNTDCGVSPTTAFSSYTNACQEVKYLIATNGTANCVGQNQTVSLSNLPSKYGVWLNGKSQGMKSDFSISIKNKLTPLNFELLDSNQLVCGTFKKSYNLLADSIGAITTTLDSSSTINTCASVIKFGFDYSGDVSIVGAKVNKNKIPLDKTLKLGKLSIANGDSIRFYATSPLGCNLNSTTKTVRLNAKPNASFTYSSSKKGDTTFYQFSPKVISGQHSWYITQSPGWVSTSQNPLLNTYPFRMNSSGIVVYHQIQLSGDSCINLDSSHLPIEIIGNTRSISAVDLKLYPNPQKMGATMEFRSHEAIKSYSIMDPMGKRIQDFAFITPSNIGSFSLSISQGQYLILFTTISGAIVYKQFQVIE